MWIGFFLILAGILVLLSNIGVLRGDVWDYIWPLGFIMLGISMVFKRFRGARDSYPIEPESKASAGPRT